MRIARCTPAIMIVLLAASSGSDHYESKANPTTQEKELTADADKILLFF